MNKEKSRQSYSRGARKKNSKNKSEKIVGGANQKVISILLFVFAVVLYINTLQLQYAYDDSAVITQNQFTQQGIKGIPALFTNDLFAGLFGKGSEIGGRYRPLTVVTYAIEYQFFGLNPRVSHFINILLYGLLAILIYRTLRLIMPGKELVSLITTLLFIAHPIHTEVVANIKSRDEILSLLGIMAMFYYLFRYFQVKKVNFLVWSGVFYFLSLISKENGITFLIIIPLTIYCFSDLQLRKIVTTTIPFFAILILYFILRTIFVGMMVDKSNMDIIHNPFLNATLSQQMATIMYILGKYLSLLFFPHPLSSDYSYNEIPIIGLGNWKALLSTVVFSVMGIYSLIKIWKKDIVAYGLLFYLISMSLVSNIFFNIGAPMGERFEFLPSLGFLLAFTVGILRLMKIENLRSIKMPARLSIPLVLVLILFSLKTFSRNLDWYDDETLFTADISNSPNSASIHSNLAIVYTLKAEATADYALRKEFFQKAIDLEKKAIKIYPHFSKAYYNLGRCYYQNNAKDSAEFAFRKAALFDENYLEALSNLGLCLIDRGKTDSAIIIYNSIIKKDSTFSQAFLNIGACYDNLKEYDKAVYYFEKAALLDPGNTSVLNYIQKIKEWKQNSSLHN